MHSRPLIPWRATVEEVNNAIQEELDASGANLGYRRICVSLKKQKILVRKEDIRTVLELNAERVHQRKRRKLVRRKYRMAHK